MKNKLSSKKTAEKVLITISQFILLSDKEKYPRLKLLIIDIETQSKNGLNLYNIIIKIDIQRRFINIYSTIYVVFKQYLIQRRHLRYEFSTGSFMPPFYSVFFSFFFSLFGLPVSCITEVGLMKIFFSFVVGCLRILGSTTLMTYFHFYFRFIIKFSPRNLFFIYIKGDFNFCIQY